jgi:hypothetical protein
MRSHKKTLSCARETSRGDNDSVSPRQGIWSSSLSSELGAARTTSRAMFRMWLRRTLPSAAVADLNVGQFWKHSIEISNARRHEWYAVN